MSDHLDKNHSFLGGLHLRHPIIILYEIGGKACLNDGHQIVPNITVICDMVSKLLEGRYAKYISDTTDTETCFNTTIVPLPVPALVWSNSTMSIWRMSYNNDSLKKEIYV